MWNTTRMWVLVCCAAGLGGGWLASGVSARPVHVLTWEETYRDASLIVIATPTGTRDYSEFTVDGTPDQTTNVLTEFRVESIVQGTLAPSTDNSPRTFSIRHLRYVNKSSEVSVVDGPAFVEFDPSFKNRYLIILKRENEQYVPLSGQYDAPQSFFLLKPYHITDERKPVPLPE
jgi:hypothetical protein